MGILKFGKKKHVEPGRLIVIDGSDGTGKATQTRMLAEEFKLLGKEVEIADFPRYGQPSAMFVEQYLLEKKYGQVNPRAASIFFALDRFEASSQIRQWLFEGKIVISNRYVTSSAGHQGGKIADNTERIKFFRWLDQLEYEIFAIPRPDLTVILHMPAELAQKLAKKKWKEQSGHTKGHEGDLHESDLRHLQNAELVFVEISKLYPNTKLVDCVIRTSHDGASGSRQTRNGVEEVSLLTPQEVHNKIWELVRRVALKEVQATMHKKAVEIKKR